MEKQWSFEKIDSLLENEKYYAKQNYVPIIRQESAKYLYDFVKSNNIKNVLEIGTAIGYSGSIMLSAGIAHLTTIDINSEYLKMAKQNFERFGFLDKVTIFCDDAKIVLEKLANSGEKFDLIFLDGAKGQYINYLPVLKKLLDFNGVIFADNVFLSGLVESDEPLPHKKRTMVVRLREYLSAIQNPPFETTIVRLEDGIAITKIKGGNND